MQIEVFFELHDQLPTLKETVVAFTKATRAQHESCDQMATTMSE